MNFRNLIKNKSIIYIPIYSMFNHENGIINLTCDGNVNRWMTAFSKNQRSIETSLTIFGPKKSVCKNYKEFINKLNKVQSGINYIESDLICKSAGYQRSDIFGNKFIKKFSKILKISCNSLIIIEGQGLLRSFLAIKSMFKNFKNNFHFPKLVFWCPVCQTNKKTRSFFGKNDKEENEILFKEVDYIIISSKDQLEYLKECNIKQNKIIYFPEFIDRNLDIFKTYKKYDQIIDNINNLGKHVIYLPFRLSDEGYKIWEIIKVSNLFPKVEVICPNVNGTTNDELIKLCTLKSDLKEIEIKQFLKRISTIGSSRDVYYSIIDNCKNVIIPYFEDIDFIMHASVDELIRGNKKPICKIVQTKEKFIQELKNV